MTVVSLQAESAAANTRDTIYELALSAQSLTRRISALVEAIRHANDTFDINGDKQAALDTLDQMQSYTDMIAETGETLAAQAVQLESAAMALPKA